MILVTYLGKGKNDNKRIRKRSVMIQPSHISFTAMIHRLIEVGLANMNFVNVLALVGATFYVLTQLVRTIVPLRVIAILSNIFASS